LKIRQFKDEDWPKFCQFVSENIEGRHCIDKKFNEHWFKTLRYDGWSCMMLEALDGHLAGIMMFIIVPVWFAGQEHQMAWISTTAVDSESQVRGAGAMLYLWGYRTFPIVGGLAGNENSNPINDQLGQKVDGIYMRRYLYLHTPKVAELCLPKHQNIIKSLSFSPKILVPYILMAQPTEHIPLEYDTLWSEFREKLVLTTNRDRRYLEWRYQSPPYIQYQYLEMRADNELKGFSVIRIQETPKGQVVRVMELVAKNGWENTAWQAILAYAEAAGALFTDFQIIGTCYNQSLENAGFLESTETNDLSAIPNLLSPVAHRQWSRTCHIGGRLAKKNQSWCSPDKVYFTKGDSDRDWPTDYDLKQLEF
jgi:hypothetical protein